MIVCNKVNIKIRTFVFNLLCIPFNSMKPIFLIGYMASGKTTLGKNLAHAMNLEFIDIDIFIEARYHATVKEIFEKQGEEAFRKIEKKVIEEVCQFENVIVACGGGTPCFYDNMELMNKNGLTVYLEVSEECIFNRITVPAAQAKRPLVANKTDEEVMQFIHKALNERRNKYEEAQITFNAEELESSHQIEASTKALQNILEEAL